MRVVAVVVTFNRKELLVQCLDAIARQTVPVAEVVLVDNASTDGTADAVRGRPGVSYVRLGRNGGGAEGFHHGIRIALERDSDWLWLMDDDCDPPPDALERLLASPHATDPGTAVLAPVVKEPGGAVLPINRGHVRPRWFFAPLVAASPEEQAPGTETEIAFCSFVGPLLRTAAAREIGLPMSEMFIRFEDVEYLQRLRPGRRMWLVGASTIVHKDPHPVAGSHFRAMWGDYAQRVPFSEQWKRLYGFRNLIYTARRGGYLNAGQALSQFLVQAVRTLLFHERRARTLLLLAAYGLDGWRGRFRNVPPARWGELARTRRPLAFVSREALAYDSGSSPPAASPEPAPSPATPRG
jgi:rhamnopyranosyl-N-acetylglucosaminyl-diphospho-decaprenol beta-1,3/1,4-galactofuranosyltransferase